MFNPQKRKHRIIYAQNFLKNPSLAQYVVNKLSNISSQDTVIEVGPGRGVITEALFSKTRNLILVEKDKKLFQELCDLYKGSSTVKVINEDVLKFRVNNGKKYKVFSNPPFNILSQLVKSFVFKKNAPIEMYLFMQKEAQQRFSGKPYENQLSVIIKTFYETKELHKFKKTDFSPVPSVDVVLVGFYKRQNTKVTDENKREYILFVQYGFQQQKASLAKNFGKIFTYEQWKRLSKNLGFSLKSKTSHLIPEQWVGLFTFYKSSVSPERQSIVQAFKPST